MEHPIRNLGVIVMLLLLAGPACVWADDHQPLRVLILSGQNNHNWRETTPKLKSILEADGLFTVAITEHPEQCDAASLAGYDVLLSNWNTFGRPAVTNWSPALREAFVSFVRGGKGLVTVHAGGSSFYDWPEYQQLTGAVWGPETSHGQTHTNEILLVTTNHPVTAGLKSFTTFDEYWQNARVSPGATPLAEVLPKSAFGGSGQPEPVAFVQEFGRGRSFCLLLGHDVRAMESQGFADLLRRGTEWAASGKVSAAASQIRSKNP